MSVRQVIAAVLVAVLAAVTLPGVPGVAAFTVTTFSQGNAFGTPAVPGAGALWSWGDTGDAPLSPERVDEDTTWATVASGDHWTCGIKGAGTLWCWGQGSTAGQLGVGDGAARALPTRVGTATTWQQVAAGGSHTCAVRTDGTLWCWGDGANGKLGLGSTTSWNTPQQVTSPGATGWASVAAGNQSTCAVRTDGGLYCFGRNGSGETGAGSTTPATQPTPTAVTSPAATGWSAVSLGYQHACALRTDRGLYCWGDGGAGRLGVGTTAQSPTPQQVTGSWDAVGLGTDHSCGIRTGGTLWCWGAGADGRLGTGATADRTSPAQVGTATTWRSVGGTHYSTCGSQSDGTLWCWGDNTWGQLGVGDTTDRTVPVRVGGDSDWTVATPGPVANQACSVRTGRTLWCWGDLQSVHFLPYRVGAATTWTSASSGDRYTCGTRADGTLWCWGRNDSGRLGHGDTVTRSAPTRVGTASTWRQVTTGSAHACAVGTDTTLWCWGAGGSGQLGRGSTAGATTPQQVTSPGATGWAGVSAGNLFTCATRTDGSLYCFGRNASGETGTGSTTPATQLTPVAVTAPAATGWTTVSLGYQHACALRTDRSLHCWGDGGGGRLGQGSVANSSTPVQVNGLWTAVGLGTDHTCGVRATGTLHCWGTGGQRPARHRQQRQHHRPGPGGHRVELGHRQRRQHPHLRHPGVRDRVVLGLECGRADRARQRGRPAGHSGPGHRPDRAIGRHGPGLQRHGSAERALTVRLLSTP